VVRFCFSDLARCRRSRRFSRPSACVPQPATHPGVGLLLKTKVKAQFNRTVTERSKPFFYRFCQSNRCHFAGHFTLVTLGRRIDRQWVASKLPSILPKAGGQSPERSRRGAAQPRVERSKSAKPTLRPSAYIFQPATPPGSFPFLLQRKHFLNSTLGWPLGDACVTLGWRLGDPCVTLA
jgi:hypothetical protein